MRPDVRQRVRRRLLIRPLTLLHIASFITGILALFTILPPMVAVQCAAMFNTYYLVVFLVMLKRL